MCEDRVAQNALYLLGDCYVRLGRKKEARSMFQQASKMNFDAKIFIYVQYFFIAQRIEKTRLIMYDRRVLWIPARLQEFMKGTKQSIPMSKEFKDFKEFLMKE